MLVTKQPVLKRFWYPEMPIANLSSGKPQSFELLGQKIVLWLDAEGKPSAEDIIAFDRAVTLEDKAVLESTDYDAPLDLSMEQHMTSDRPGIIMRNKLSALLNSHGEEEQRRS